MCAMRRMFSQRITNSARFLKMPTSSQALYFHLGMHADDDGVIEAFQVMRLAGYGEDDLKILVAKEFIKVLNDDLVVFLLDWKEHNLIRADRKIDSIYKNLLVRVMPEIELLEAKPRADTGQKRGGRPVDANLSAQDRLGKDKLIEYNTSKDNIEIVDEKLTPSQFAKEFFQNQEPIIQELLENGLPENVIRQEVAKFVSYWTELNKSGTKQRWELEKTFEIKRRLATWFRNVNSKYDYSHSAPKAVRIS